jgi:hypothetical protein
MPPMSPIKLISPFVWLREGWQPKTRLGNKSDFYCGMEWVAYLPGTVAPETTVVGYQLPFSGVSSLIRLPPLPLVLFPPPFAV